MMCDQEERPGAIYQTEDEEKAREDIEEMLDMIYKETEEPGCSVRKCPEPISEDSSIYAKTEENPLIFPGRYVTKVVCVFPLEVSKRFIRPHLSNEGQMQPSAEFIVQKLFGVEKLGNILLLITPTAMASRRVDKYIVHCYAVDTQWHLGVTSLIGRECKLIKDAENPDKYSVIFCSSYIELEDAFMPTSIKSQLFDVLRKRSINPTEIWYKGSKMALQYWSSDPKRYHKEIIPSQMAVSARLMQGKRAAAGSDRVSARQQGDSITKRKQRNRHNNTTSSQHPQRNFINSSIKQKRETRINETMKIRRPTTMIKSNVPEGRNRINKKSVSSVNQPNRSSNQFTNTSMSAKTQRKPKMNGLNDRNYCALCTKKLTQPIPPQPSSIRHNAVATQGHSLGSSKKSESLLRREREWGKFVASSIKRRQIPNRRKDKFRANRDK